MKRGFNDFYASTGSYTMLGDLPSGLKPGQVTSIEVRNPKFPNKPMNISFVVTEVTPDGYKGHLIGGSVEAMRTTSTLKLQP